MPPSAHPHTTRSQLGAPSAPGVHDTLRSNLSLATPGPATTGAAAPPVVLQSTHPLEARLVQWRTQQHELRQSLLRRQFGIAEPVKRAMELQIVRAGEWRPMCLGGSGGGGGVHQDILTGRDCEIDWEDVFDGGDMRNHVDFHTEMERHLGINW